MNALKLTTMLTTAAFVANTAYASDINPTELLNLSLEQLSNIDVTSVSKKAEKANEAAAAIFSMSSRRTTSTAAA